MTSATPRQQATLRNLLLRRRAELELEVNAAQDARQAQAADAGCEVHDRKDEAETHVETGLMDAQQARDLAELSRVGAALQRLNGGRYGACVQCGTAIAWERLLAQPAALRCIRCETAHETAERAAALQG